LKSRFNFLADLTGETLIETVAGMLAMSSSRRSRNAPAGVIAR
jgi:hypothetical protein